MTEFNNGEWLDAVLHHPATNQTDFDVALGLVLTGSANDVLRRRRDGNTLIAQQVVDESMTVLTELGFLEQVASIEAGFGEDRLMVFRIPVLSD